MQRLHNIKKWSHCPAGSVMNFADGGERRIRLDVNAAGKATLFYIDGDGVTTLLALVEGRDVIEFASHGGTFSVAVEDADVWAYTIDGEDVSFEIPEAETFTKLVERRSRNPEVEMMKYMMEANMQRMLDAQRDELVSELARRDRAAAAAAAQFAAASNTPADRAEPEPAEPAGSDPKPSKADGGDGAKASK